MPAPVIVAYDGSANADDAVLLGRDLARLTGGELVLAHVYRTAQPQPTTGAASVAGRAQFLSHRGEALLERAAGLAGAAPRTLVQAATTTATGIRTLAERERAAIVVFGSAHGTEPGHVHPGSAARRLLQGSPAAVAFAPVGYRHLPDAIPGRIAFAFDDDEATARRSAEALAVAGGGASSVVERAEDADLLVIGSRPGAAPGDVMIAASAEATLHAASCPAVVVARGSALPGATRLASVA